MLIDGKIIIAVDFDGTLAETDYPYIKYGKWEVIKYVLSKQTHGAIIILNTCRHGKDLENAVTFCKEQYGLVFDYVNENVPELIEKYGDCRKIAADFYIDDRAINPFPKISEQYRYDYELETML
jgi:hypothetical protein